MLNELVSGALFGNVCICFLVAPDPISCDVGMVPRDVHVSGICESQHNMDISEEIAAKEGHRKIIGKRMTEEPLVDIVDDGEY